MTDPFGAESLRAATLVAWASSPTRLREDAATESDLVRGGYRDRVLTELAQNAADAAARAGVPGRLDVRIGVGGLHIANVGAPLDESGVQALSALRVSGKTEGVGRFGVGFTAVLAIGDEVEVRSTSGSIAFSAARTGAEVEQAGIDPPESGVPVLRLVWATDAPPASGFDTEVVIAPRAGVDLDDVLTAMRGEATDILLELTALQSIRIGGDEFVRTERDLGGGLTEVTVGDGVWWQFTAPSARWLVPVSGGSVVPVAGDVLRAPTRTDEELTLPALVVASADLQPDRRRILPGAAIAHLANGYADFVAALPESQRTALVPLPGFAAGAVDEQLRESVLRELVDHPWLPGADGELLRPRDAAVLPGATADLLEILTDAVPGLVSPELSGQADARALAAVGVHRIGLARLAELLAGQDRAPEWWGRLYEALTPLVIDALAVEELSAIPVPLADGRTVTGPRTVVLGEGVGGAGVDWVRLVDPAASHPLLARLGAAQVGALDVLSDPALRDRIEALWDDEGDADELAAAVLPLVAEVSTGPLPTWLGGLPLPDMFGELQAADELLLPGAPLADVLASESPFATVADRVVEEYGAEALRALGVGWGFAVLRAELPTGPDHDLDDESDWWATLSDDPELLVAVRDLDLVDPDRWPEALTLLASDPETAALLADRDGYSAWWLRRHAGVGGVPLAALRSPDDPTFDGLLDPLDHPHADALSGALAADRIERTETAELLLDRLADPQRTPAPAVIARTHRLLAEATAAGVLDLEALSPPTRVRAISGAVVDAGDAIVLDRPWIASVVPADRLVVGDLASAGALADLLDVAPSSEAVRGEVLGTGRAAEWVREPGAVLASVTTGRPLPAGEVVVHDALTVRLSGAVSGDTAVPWWVDEAGRTHVDAGRLDPGVAGAW
ncbi:sacsin N-terminal ATP-binding-like domain-containing protein [Rhodococcus gannanensis]|uniref:Sacsin N-terminal ATP-binding-like domain-containing protein n=1 Tax=Rhodococcus gannanensis TaxID=1960308 RepID=A0ABW4NWZ2_9NOCA